ncbi:copper homeostasis protein (lipoprotein) [Pseudarcicella hirudinis]|uniref:Copper homeostasis protein (Lipoprotein) n=1 Tax=Pseudarcicella hirudinis TaxID=1079859 RepID=A0A1I5TLN1_9BACT|nr:copper resistance protein NlpE [Pseudarcicella hirudinis]SFP83960.1 copper homeostasis protein (lipoprotein) [Pseudarcicella hirudinis]
MKNSMLLMLSLASMILWNCQKSNKKDGSSDTIRLESPIAKSRSEMKGFDSTKSFTSYKGILPCADCSGLETTLKISEDGQYFELSELYQGKGDQAFVETGNVNTERGFGKDEDATLYILNWDKAETEQRYFVRLSKKPGQLTMLDRSKNLIDSKFNYALTQVK